MTSKDKALALAQQIAAKKGMDVQVFDLKRLSAFTDFFVIATGTSNRHVKTLTEEAVKTGRSTGDRPLGVEGDPPGRWVLVDMGDVVVHLFDQEARDYYSLERLWGEAERLPLPADEPLTLEAVQ